MLNKQIVYLVTILTLLAGCATSQSDHTAMGVNESMAPGLKVLYFNGMFRNVNQVPDGDWALLEKGRPGPPILIIDNQFGQDEVFDSGRNRAIGVQMKGFLLFKQKGRYELQALSNDGVKVFIDSKNILKDSQIHSDRLSDRGVVSVEKAGWHPIMVKYFQRKGTAALKLYWKTPGNDNFEVIPAMAYGHLPEKN